MEGHPAGFSANLGHVSQRSQAESPPPAKQVFRKSTSLTSEQLLATRATLWRQKAEPLLTLDDAQSWLQQCGLCLFLPRKAQIPAPAPSFVEACLGETNPTPPRTAIDGAKDLLVRLIEADSALPLNLLGTPTDHPDFLVSKEALPFVYALRGDRDWKHAPGTAGANRVSPLVTHIWKLLEGRGVLTATEIQEELGRELTEAAVLRALHELWASMRVIPLYQGGGQETLWEPLQSRHQKAMASGVGMSQVTALSVLVSVYLQSVVAAGGDDAESFLSPLASRSKVREVVRGLTATRQLALIQMETQSLLYVEGSLPEFPEGEKPAAAIEDAAPKPARRPHPTSPEGMEASLRRSAAGSSDRPAYARPAYTRPADNRPAASTTDGPAGRPPSRTGGGSFRPAAGVRPGPRKREAGGFRPAAGGARPPYRPKAAREDGPVPRSEPGSGLRADGTPKKTRWRDLPGGRPDQKGKPARFGPRKAEGAAGEGSPRPAARREPGSLRSAADARAGAKAPYKRASAPGGGKIFPPSSGPSRGGRPGGARPSFGGPATRPGGSSSRPAAGGRPPFRSADARSGSRPPARSSGGRFVARPEGARPLSRPRREDGALSSNPLEGAPAGGRKFNPKFASAGPPKARGAFSPARPGSGGPRPYTPRPGGASAAGRPSTGRPPSGKGAGGSGYKSSGPGTGAGSRPSPGPRTGGFKPGGSGTGGSRTSPRPGFGQGPRPGGGRPRTGGSGPKPTGKPGGRPPVKFKKRPGPSK